MGPVYINPDVWATRHGRECRCHCESCLIILYDNIVASVSSKKDVSRHQTHQVFSGYSRGG